MDGDEIDGRGDLAVAQPEFPHVGIGHRHRDLRLDLADDANQVGAGHLAPQQDLVADDDGDDHVRKPLRQRDRGLDLVAAAIRPVRQPQALQHLHAVTFGDFRDLVEPVIDRVGPYAVGDLLELGQILVDLPRIDGNIRARTGSDPLGTGHTRCNEAFRPTRAGTAASGPWIRAIPTPPRSLQRQSRKAHLQRPLRPVPAHTRNASLIVRQRRCQASASAALRRFFRLPSLSHLGVTSRGCFNHRAVPAAAFAAMLTEWVRM